MATFSSPDLGITLDYPENWEFDEEADRAIFSPSEAGLDVDAPEDTSLWIGIPDESSSTISELLTSILDQFPDDVEILNEGTISIAGQTWSSTQIRFDDENLGGQGIATVAVTNKDGQGYVLVALAPAEEWNSVQPLFQGVINSFRFAVEEVAAANTGTQAASSQDADTTPSATDEAEGDDEEEDEAEAEGTPTPRATPTPVPTPTPEAAATPLVYTIQSGDTLLEVANRFGVNVDLLMTENGIDNPSGLQIGQELVIPFTAEQLEAYNEGREVPAAASSSAAAETEAAEEDEETEAATTSAASAETEEAAEAEEAPAPAPAPATEAAPVSGRIVYPAYNPGISSYDIWMVDLASGEQTPIAGNSSQPTFNRDGSLLAYRSWERSTRGIFFRDFIGGRGGIVTRFVEDGLPAWAPDGFSFVFASRKEGDRVPRIYVGNQQGENPFSVGFQGEYPAAFPDGRIVAKGCLPSGDCGMFVMGARGGGEKKISGESMDTAPAVSPDGNRIAFMSSGRGARNWEIWVMGADGSNPQRLTENGNNDGLPTWSPDGKSIAYVSDQGGVWAVWAMNADGSNQRKLFNMKGSPDGKVLHDEFNSRGWLEERISWAP
jgi:LysM repeat protein